MKKSRRQLTIQRTVQITKALIWVIGIIFIGIEAREVFGLRQFTHIAFFAITLALASYQIASSDTLYAHSKKLSAKAYQSSLTMYLASILSALDAALDQAIADFIGDLGINFLLIPVFVLSWILTSSAAIIAIRSLCSFLDIFPVALSAKQEWGFSNPDQDNANQ